MNAADLYAIYSQPGESLRSTARKAQEQSGIKLSHWTVRQRLIEAGYKLKPVGNPEVEDKLETIAVRIEPEIRAWLQTLPEGEAHHVREALRQYKESLKP